MHDTDKVEGGLMVLFFGLVFFRWLYPEKFSADALVSTLEQIRGYSSCIV